MRSPLTAKLEAESEKAEEPPKLIARVPIKGRGHATTSTADGKTSPDRIPARTGRNLRQLLGVERPNKISP